MCGGIALTTALKSGKGGPINAIDSLKSLIPLFLNIIFRGLVPSLLQILGVICGIVGATIIGFDKI